MLLCERDTTMVRLTIPGEVLLREARALLRQTQEIVENTRDAANGNCGNLRIGITGYYGYFSHSVKSDTVTIYRKHFPKVNVTLVDLSMEEEQTKALKEGRVHICFCFDFQPAQMRGVSHLAVAEMPIRAYMGTHHPLAHQEAVTLEDLAAHPLLEIGPFEKQTESLVEVFRNKGLEPSIVKRTNSVTSCMAMLATGDNVAMMPEMKVVTQNHKVLQLPIKDNVPGLQIRMYAIWRKNSSSPHVHNFIELLRQVVSRG